MIGDDGAHRGDLVATRLEVVKGRAADGEPLAIAFVPLGNPRVGQQ
jgi:hypothetical protein